MSRFLDAGFKDAQKWLARAEGSGFTNDPDDDGGPTKAGMTEASWHEWEAYIGRPQTLVKGASAEEIGYAYFDLYWASPQTRCIDVSRRSWPVALCYYDACVVTGRGYAPRMLQRALQVEADGKVGPRTMQALHHRLQTDGELEVLTRMLADRRARFFWCVEQDPTDRKYLKGWLNRLIRLRVFLRQPRREWEANDVEAYGCEAWD